MPLPWSVLHSSIKSPVLYKVNGPYVGGSVVVVVVLVLVVVVLVVVVVDSGSVVVVVVVLVVTTGGSVVVVVDVEVVVVLVLVVVDVVVVVTPGIAAGQVGVCPPPHAVEPVCKHTKSYPGTDRFGQGIYPDGHTVE